MVIGFAIMLAGLAVGLPIYAALLASGAYLMVFSQHIDPSMMASGLFESINSFTLAAVPFFLLAGALMDRTSMSSRLVGSIQAFVGHRKGGVALSGVIANELFGAISGSSAAAVGTIGRVMQPMVAEQHGESFSLGLLTSAGALAIVMPPSITMILFASAANISTGKLFLAGVVPALIIGACLWGAIAWNSRNLPSRTGTFSWPVAIKAVRHAFWVLALPVIVLGGIYAGWFTPTEAAVVSVGYSFIVGFFIYKDIDGKALWSAVTEAGRLTSQIFIIIAASAVFSSALTLAGVPQKLAEATAHLSPTVFLLVVNVVLLLVGMFFDPTSAVLVLTPLMAPAAQALGIDLIHLGIVMTINLAIGMFTPPFGLNLFVSQSVFKRSTKEIVEGLTPFWGWYFAALVILTYLPQLYMWLPNLMN